MKKMSQKELLREGFGSALIGAAKTAASTAGKAALGAAKAVARDAAPVTSGIVSDVVRALTPEEELFAKNKNLLDSKLKADPNIDTFNITHHDKETNTWAAEVADDETKFFKLDGDNFEEITPTPGEQAGIINPGNATPEPGKGSVPGSGSKPVGGQSPSGSGAKDGQAPKPGAKPVGGQAPKPLPNPKPGAKPTPKPGAKPTPKPGGKPGRKPGGVSRPLPNPKSGKGGGRRPKSPNSGDNQPAPDADTGTSITMQGPDMTRNTGSTTTIQADQQSQKDIIKNSRAEKLKPKKKKSSPDDNYRDGFEKIDFSKKS